jgi:hypothetical protein
MVAKTPCPLERAKASRRVDISAGLMAARDHFNLSTHPGWSFQASTWVATTPRPRPSGFWGRPSLSPRRKATHRICGGKVPSYHVSLAPVIPGEKGDPVSCKVPSYHVSLAPATSEVDLLPRTATARLMHPTRASEEVEGFGIIPDFFQGYLRYLGEIEGEEEGCGAGQGPTVGGHYQVGSSPTSHAQLGILGVEVRNHPNHLHDTRVSGPPSLDLSGSCKHFDTVLPVKPPPEGTGPRSIP